jgi:hypothetical protein
MGSRRRTGICVDPGLADENPRYFVGTALLPIGRTVVDVPKRSAAHVARGGVNYRFNCQPVSLLWNEFRKS